MENNKVRQFVDLGMSDSVWGGEEWHEMTYYLRQK